MLQQTFDQLRELRLGGCAAALREQLDNLSYQELSFDERLAMIIEREHLLRHNRRLERNLRQAKLKQQAVLEELDFEVSRGLKRAQVLELAGGGWLDRKQNLFIVGPTGVGKTYIACALAARAVQTNRQALYAKTSELLSDAALARADGSYAKFAARLSRISLLIFDEWLRDPLDAHRARLLLDILDDRYNCASTMFVSQLPVENWHENIQDPTIADAILDRVIHNAHRITLHGQSMRKLGIPDSSTVDGHSGNGDRRFAPTKGKLKIED
jgi:DNA replication protein DnaC